MSSAGNHVNLFLHTKRVAKKVTGQTFQKVRVSEVMNASQTMLTPQKHKRL